MWKDGTYTEPTRNLHEPNTRKCKFPEAWETFSKLLGQSFISETNWWEFFSIQDYFWNSVKRSEHKTMIYSASLQLRTKLEEWKGLQPTFI